ncbi:MAG: DUF2339 domain-containing protein [Candidatus Gracilibacteria bacterium]|nr:DUF2339 domain-containing protein [Candidatus Gracilibacteria bacterium]
MTSLLNRIARILSLALGMTLAFIVVLLLFDYTEGFGTFLFIGIIFSLLIKGIFLSEEYIKNKVTNYTNEIISGTEEKFGIKKEGTTQKQELEEIPTYDIAKELKEKENKTRDDQTTYAYQEKSYEATNTYIQKPERPKEPNFLEKFFAENALAKIGGILLFLGVLFFLSLVVNALGPVGKIGIGFVVGFAIFSIGTFLDKKGFEKEGRILIGVGILVNYLVILSGRYILGDETNSGNTLTSEGTTFIFLILNTIFSVVISLSYKSKNLLLFSFVFAYLNPLLIGAKPDSTPFTLVGYSFIISIGALALAANYFKNQEESFGTYLAYTALIGGNILFLLAPFTTEIHWLIKLVFMGILSFKAILLNYKFNKKTDIGSFYMLSYIAFIALLFNGGQTVLHTPPAFFGYIGFIAFSIILMVFLLINTTLKNLASFLFVPLFIIFGLLSTGSLYLTIPVIALTTFSFIVIFSLLANVLSNQLKYIFFIILSIFLFCSNLAITGSTSINIKTDLISYIGICITGIVFLLSAYFFSKKEDMENLYSIGTIGTAFLFLPIIYTKGDFVNYSIICIVIFTIANIVLPFVNKNLCARNIRSLAIGLITGILFIAGELYNFGEIAKLFPGLTLGFSFMGLAATYFIAGYLMMTTMDFNLLNTAKNEIQEMKRNTIYGYLGIAISLFSIAILIIFADQKAVITAIWLFEATILFFFYKKVDDIKIYLGGVVLFIIGLLKLGGLVGGLMINSDDQQLMKNLSELGIIFIPLALNLSFLKNMKDSRFIHDGAHIFGILLFLIGINCIIPNHPIGYSYFGISIFLTILLLLYDFFGKKTLNYFICGTLHMYYIIHFFNIQYIFSDINSTGNFGIKFLQYLAVFIPGIWILFRRKISKDLFKNPIITITYVVYLFAITTYFIYELFNTNVFSITIYWALWAYGYIAYGINKDVQKYRTIGLYILCLVLGKILFYDIWYGISDAILRVVALMFVGGLMIYISMLYSKKYSGNLLNEFDLKGFGFNSENFDNDEVLAKETVENNKEEFLVNKKIKDIDIGDTKTITFEIGERKIIIKSVNLIKFGKLLCGEFGKQEFKPKELEQIYTYTIKNYKTTLSEEDYKKIMVILKEFVSNGGKIIFN